MEKILIIFAFIVIRWLFSASKQKKKQPTPPKQTSKPAKGLDDIFGDFMKEINKENEPKKVVKPMVSENDNHKAEADTHKKLDWQEVTKSKFQEKEQLIDHSDYQNISHSDIPDEPIVATTVENDIDIEDLGNIDLRKAILYKEILDRKYFSI